MDPNVWSGAKDSHPVESFWPGRFLKFIDPSDSPQFSLAGKEGSWIPFGSGANICPGRHFAKIHCIVTLAMMVQYFDWDILAVPKDLEVDLGKFATGVVGPCGKVAVQLRPRDMKH
jgi:cytochrome P450